MSSEIIAPGVCRYDDEYLPADIWRTNGGIYLGLTPKNRTNQFRPLAGKELDETVPHNFPIRSTWQPDGKFNLYQGEGHVAIVAPQGSGKSRKLLLPNLFRLRQWSRFAIDLKGELTATTALYLSQVEGHTVDIVDPFGVIPREYPRLYAQAPKLFASKGFNHIAALEADKPSFADDAKAFASAVVPIEEGTRDSYFPLAAQALTKGVTMALRVDNPGMSDNLEALRRVLGMKPEDLAKFIALMITRHGKKYPAIAASLGEFATFRAEDREIGGIRRNAKVQTDWIDSPLIQADCKHKNSIDFGAYKDRPHTCFVILPPGELVNQAVWLRLMLTAALRPLLRSTKRAPVPVLFMLDEFAACGHMKFLLDNIALLRGFGVKLMTVWQSVDQMQSVYPKSWETFMGTAQAKVVFTADDWKTLDYFSRFAGERLYKHTSVSSSRTKTYNRSTSSNNGSSFGLIGGGSHNFSNGDGTSDSWGSSDSVSTSEQHMSERVVKPYEIAALDADEAIIFSRRGRIHRTILPQPHRLVGLDQALAEVEPLITDRPKGITRDPGRTVAPDLSPSSVVDLDPVPSTT